MNILVVDDHPLIVEAISTVIEALRPDCTIRSVDRVEHVAPAGGEAPAIVLLDLSLPGLSGLDALDAVHRRLPDSAIVVFSAMQDATLIAQALRRGARGFIPKTSPRRVMADALRLVLDGGMYVPPDILAAVGSTAPADAADPAAQPVPTVSPGVAAVPAASVEGPLTERQREIISLLADGLTTKQISRRLGISINTVKSHVAVIFRTLGVANRTQAVAVASELGRTAPRA